MTPHNALENNYAVWPYAIYRCCPPGGTQSLQLFTAAKIYGQT